MSSDLNHVREATCAESRAGRTADALEHLRRAVAVHGGCAEMARHDSDFDGIRGDPAFVEIVGAGE